MVQIIKAYQADVSMGFHPRLEHPPKVKFYARVSSRVPFLYLKNKQPNLAFYSGRLTSSSNFALSRSFSVQKLFFHDDVIAITSCAPDVVNLVRLRCCELSAPQTQKVLVKCRQNVANKLLISRYFNPVVPIHLCVQTNSARLSVY